MTLTIERLRRLLKLYPISLFALVAVWVANALPAGATEVGEVTVEYRKDRYHLFGQSVIEAPRELIFDVLTDFNNFHLMATGIAETKFLIENGERLGYTRIDTCILFYCRDVEKVERVETKDKR